MSKVRPFWAVVGFSLFLLVLMVVGIQAEWGILGQPPQAEEVESDIFNEAALDDPVADVLGVDLNIRVIPPSSTEENRELKFQLEYVTILFRDTDPDLEVSRVCLNDVLLALTPLDTPESGVTDYNYDYFVEDANPLCFVPTEDDILAEYALTDDLVYEQVHELGVKVEPARAITFTDAEEISQNFWYPYDAIDLTAYLQVHYTVWVNEEVETEGTISPLLDWDYLISGTRQWDIALETQELNQTEADNWLYSEGPVTQLHFELARPFLFQLIFPVFMLGMVFLIALVPSSADQDILVGITVSLLFGIFGLKGILGPSDAMGQTLLNLGLIGLYVILGFATVLYFLKPSPSDSSKD
jgi:hypothetical protein